MFDRDITFRRYLTVTLFVFLLSPLHIMAAEAPDTADVRNHVIAVVNGKELTLEDFNAFISTRIGERQTSLNAQQINAPTATPAVVSWSVIASSSTPCAAARSTSAEGVSTPSERFE